MSTKYRFVLQQLWEERSSKLNTGSIDPLNADCTITLTDRLYRLAGQFWTWKGRFLCVRTEKVKLKHSFSL